MKYWVFILLFAACNLSAQQYIRLSDANDSLPVSSGYIKFSSPDSAYKSFTLMSDITGLVKYTGPVPFSLKAYAMGYKDALQEISGHTRDTLYLFLQPDAFYMQDAVVTASPVPVKIDQALHPVRVITRQQIEARGANNLRDLLTQELNIRVSQDAVLGSGMQFMGVGGENVKILIDGVPVIGRLDGNIDISQLNLNNIERVEIIEGPASIFYGTNALGGVINLITRKDQASDYQLGVKGYYETVGQYNFDFNAGLKQNKHLFQLTGGRYFFDGFTTRDTLKRFMDWKPREQYFADMMHGYRANTWNISYQGNIFREMIQAKGEPDKPFYVTATDQYYRTLRTTHTLSFKKYFGKHHVLDITASYGWYQRRRQSFYKDLVTLNQSLFDENIDVFHQGLNRNVYAFFGKIPWFSLQAGTEILAETAEGLRIKDGFQWTGDFAGFAELEFKPLKWLTVKPGARYSYNTRFRTVPTFAAHLKVTPVKNWDIRVSYSRGFRAPVLKELFFEFVDINHNIHGNPNLKPEQSHAVNAKISYKRVWEKWSMGVSLNGYYNDIQNQIKLVIVSISADSNIYRYENIDRYRAAGGGAELYFSHKLFDIQAGTVLSGIKNEFNGIPGSRFVFSPEISLKATIHLHWWKGDFSVIAKYTGNQPYLYVAYDDVAQTDVIREGIIGGYPVLDVSYIQRFWKGRIVLGLYGKNLIGITNLYQTGDSSQGGAHEGGSGDLLALWGRTFAVSLAFNFTAKK